MSGRNPIPTALKLVTGKKGRGINKKEPVFDPLRSKCPLPLDDVGKKEWSRLSKLLGESGVLTEADLTPLAICCRIWSQIVMLSAELAKPTDYMAFDIIINSDTGDPIKANAKTNPLAVRLDNLYTEYRSYFGLFGIGPVNRCKIQTKEPTSKKDHKERFFK